MSDNPSHTEMLANIESTILYLIQAPPSKKNTEIGERLLKIYRLALEKPSGVPVKEVGL